MKTWLSLLLILFFSVIFPLSAVPADLVSPQLASPQLFSIEFNNVYSNKNLTQKKSEYNAEILTNAKQDLEGLFAPQLFRPMASLFQARVQTDPEYLLKINFSPQTLVLRLFNLSFYQ